MPHTRFPELQSCTLCGSSAPLQRSHLLPNFLFKLLREPTGRFIAASLPQRPLQAGPVAKMLCFECEQRLSLWENEARQAFFPTNSSARLPVKYATWLQLFAVSISWRALTFLKYSTQNPYVSPSPAAQRLLPTLPPEFHERAEQIRVGWGSYLLSGYAPPSLNDQHLLYLNGENFPNERSGVVGFTVCNTDSLTGVFSQLGPICVLGVLHDERPLDWKSTRVQSLGGKFHAAKQTIPAAFGAWLRTYFENISEIEA